MFVFSTGARFPAGPIRKAKTAAQKSERKLESLSPSPPPLERQRSVRIVELTISKVTILSMLKRKLWKLSFRHYLLKAGIPMWIFALRVQEGVLKKKKGTTNKTYQCLAKRDLWRGGLINDFTCKAPRL